MIYLSFYLALSLSLSIYIYINRERGRSVECTRIPRTRGTSAICGFGAWGPHGARTERCLKLTAYTMAPGRAGGPGPG